MSMQRTPSILVTGFGDWGSHVDNPAARIAGVLAAEGVDAHILPVSYRDSCDAFDALYTKSRPDIVLCLGLAESAQGFQVELIACNALNVTFRDAAGVAPAPLIDPAGPATLPTRLPVQSILQNLQAQNFPCSTSDDAGGFVCNNLFYHAMKRAGERQPQAMAGFVHIPRPGNGLDEVQLLQGIKIILAQCVQEFLHRPSNPAPKL